MEVAGSSETTVTTDKILRRQNRSHNTNFTTHKIIKSYRQTKLNYRLFECMPRYEELLWEITRQKTIMK
jgi:hypothetical protein